MMARIRTVKPALFRHGELFDAEKETGLPLRIAFVGMFTCCDREGRFKWEPRELKLDVLPHDEIDFSRVLDALLSRGFIRQYRVDGKLYGIVPTFAKHQVINNRESASDLPEPNENNYLEWDGETDRRAPHASGTRGLPDDDASTTPLVHAQGEGKGREGKGKEGEKSNVPPDGETAGPVQVVFDYWREKMEHPRAQLDAKRKRAIAARLKDGYTPEELCKAVDGCKISPHHQGQNDTQTVYDDIELICRDCKHVDAFLKFYSRGVVPQSSFRLAGLDHTSSQQAMERSMQRNGIAAPAADDEISFN